MVVPAAGLGRAARRVTVRVVADDPTGTGSRLERFERRARGGVGSRSAVRAWAGRGETGRQGARCQLFDCPPLARQPLARQPFADQPFAGQTLCGQAAGGDAPGRVSSSSSLGPGSVILSPARARTARQRAADRVDLGHRPPVGVAGEPGAAGRRPDRERAGRGPGAGRASGRSPAGDGRAGRGRRSGDARAEAGWRARVLLGLEAASVTTHGGPRSSARRHPKTSDTAVGAVRAPARGGRRGRARPRGSTQCLRIGMWSQPPRASGDIAWYPSVPGIVPEGDRTFPSRSDTCRANPDLIGTHRDT